MNDLQIIDQREILGKPFTLYGDIDVPLFLAKDVAAWIDYTKTGEGYYDVSAMLRTVDDSEKTTINNRSYLTEYGLYEVLMQSRKPIAKAFKREVKEILRTIRKRGGYLTPAKIEEILLNPDAIIRLATDLKSEREKNRTLLVQNDALAAKNEDLSVKLNESEKFWTIVKFNQHFNLRWDMETCQRNGKIASAHSRQRGYEVRKCRTNDERFKETNSYVYEVLEKLFL